MAKISEEEKIKRKYNRRVHLANERTFLAWIRTSIAIMAFGFIVEKFALFLKQIHVFFGKEPQLSTHGYSSYLGIFLIILGASMGVLSFIRYKKVEKQIDEDIYEPSLILDLLLILSLIAVAMFLIIYLFHSI